MSLYSYSLLAGILMPGIPGGSPIAPGIAGGNTYPQYGVGGGTPGQAGGWNIKVARNGAEKMQDINQGYATWFSSRSAAQNFISSESSAYQSGEGGLSGLAAIGDFFARLTEANTWIRVGEFIAGALILYIGLKAVVAPEGQRIASRTAKQTAKSIYQRSTPTGRATRTIQKHTRRQTVKRAKRIRSGT